MKSVGNFYALICSVRDLNDQGIHQRWSFSLALFDQRGFFSRIYKVRSGVCSRMAFGWLRRGGVAHGGVPAHAWAPRGAQEQEPGCFHDSCACPAVALARAPGISRPDIGRAVSVTQRDTARHHHGLS